MRPWAGPGASQYQLLSGQILRQKLKFISRKYVCVCICVLNAHGKHFAPPRLCARNDFQSNELIRRISSQTIIDRRIQEISMHLC